MKLFAAQQEGHDSREGRASGQGAGGQWFESRRGKLFLLILNDKFILAAVPELNCLFFKSNSFDMCWFMFYLED